MQQIIFEEPYFSNFYYIYVYRNSKMSASVKTSIAKTKKVRKFKSTSEAIKVLSNEAKKRMFEKHGKKFLSDCNI